MAEPKESVSRLPVIDDRSSYLPIPDRKNLNPFFNLDELVFREHETSRVECSFANIQEYLRSFSIHQIPDALSLPLVKMGRWQLVFPNTFDLSQILFIGRSSYPKGYIPIEEAQATIYFHRGAEDGNKPNDKPYTKPWKMELTSVYPDSNGTPRVVSVYYRLHMNEGDFSSQGVRISIRDDELVGLEKRSDTVFGPVLKYSTEIPEITFRHFSTSLNSHPFTKLGVGVITPAMFDLALEQHRMIAAPFHIKDPYTAHHKIGRWEIGLDHRQTDHPWFIMVPDFLENPTKSLPDQNIQ